MDAATQSANEKSPRRQFLQRSTVAIVGLIVSWTLMLYGPLAVVLKFTGIALIGDYFLLCTVSAILTAVACASYVLLTLSVTAWFGLLACSKAPVNGRLSGYTRMQLVNTLIYVGFGTIGLIPAALGFQTTAAFMAAFLTSVFGGLLLAVVVLMLVILVPTVIVELLFTRASKERERIARG